MLIATGILIKRAFDYHLLHPSELQSTNYFHHTIANRRPVCLSHADNFIRNLLSYKNDVIDILTHQNTLIFPLPCYGSARLVPDHLVLIFLCITLGECYCVDQTDTRCSLPLTFLTSGRLCTSRTRSSCWRRCWPASTAQMSSHQLW